MNKRLVDYFKALSNPVRLQVFMYIVDQSEGLASGIKEEMCVCEIADAVGAPQPTVSNHLKVLEKAGLITSIKIGTRCYQLAAKDAATDLLKHMQYISDQAHKLPSKIIRSANT